jgi:hypothetical protein
MEEQFDDNIKTLCEEVRAFVPLTFEQHDKKCYNSIIKKEDGVGKPIAATVWYYEPLCLAKIAHELYHLKIGLTMGDNADMLATPESGLYAKMILSKEFCSDFLNQAEHVIFYPYYHEQGYSDDEFFEEIAPEQFIPILDDIVKGGLKNRSGEYIFNRVCKYIKLITLFMFFPIDNRFAVHNRQLKHVDATLYNIMKTFKRVIQGMKIAPGNWPHLEGAYVNYRKEIEKWTRNHNIALG